MADDRKNLLTYLLKKPGDAAPDWVRMGSGLNVAEPPADPPEPAPQSAPDMGSVFGGDNPRQNDNRAGSGEDDDPEPQRTGSGQSMGYGAGMGLAGTATGVPGLGVAGAAIGTAIDNHQANTTLNQFSTPHTQVSYGPALADNLSFGMFGKSTVEQAIDSIQSNPSVTGPAAAQAQIALDAFGGGGDQQYGNTGTGAPSPEPGGAYGYDPDGGVSGGAYGYDPDGGVSQGMWAEGGFVTKDRLVGPDPEGPDDGYGRLDEGEAVIPTKMVEKYGEDAMQILINGKPTREQVRKALGLKVGVMDNG